MTKEEKDKQVEARKIWLKKQPYLKREALKARMREYSKNRYYNHIIFDRYYLPIDSYTSDF